MISHDEAARIVGHFGEVKDKLLNTLQLREQTRSNFREPEADEASIASGRELSLPYRRFAAIDLSKTASTCVTPCRPLAVLILLLFAAPSLNTDPANRIIKHGSGVRP